MIEIGIPHFFTSILFITAAVVGLGLLRDEMRDRRAAKSARRDILRCRGCGAVVRLQSREVIQTCPGCSTSVRRGRDRRLG